MSVKGARRIGAFLLVFASPAASGLSNDFRRFVLCGIGTR